MGSCLFIFPTEISYLQQTITRSCFFPPISSSSQGLVFTVKPPMKDSTLNIVKCNMKRGDYGHKFEKRSNPNTYERAAQVIAKALKVVRKPAMMVKVLWFLLVYASPRAALALSGGAMGGGGSFSDHYASDSDDDSDGDYCLSTMGFFVALFILISISILVALSGAHEYTSVMKLQVRCEIDNVM